MLLSKYILTLDQGTTSSRAILFDSFGNVCGKGQKEFTQIYPQPGFVEHDAVEILESILYAVRQAVESAGVKASDIAAISITNQRETTVAWDRRTGIPIHHAIVWQCRRTAPLCEQLKEDGLESYIRDTTGLIIDPYFSGTKMQWILQNVPQAKVLAEQGDLCFGTIDSWLIFSLTEGKTYVTDVSNASRTMLFNIHNLDWDEKLLNYFDICREALPRVVESSGVVGFCSDAVLGIEIPIAGIAGDQHAALFGQGCFSAGDVKNTYGTGCFVLMNTGETPVKSNNGLLTTVAWKIGGKVSYALEGSAFNAGSAIQWLRDELEIIKTPQECDQLAESVGDSGGVSFVPAFTGLGAPYWDMYARGAMFGITRGTGRAEICRAVLESIALESNDLFVMLEQESGVKISEIRVDGGASKSRFLMQYQADISRTKVFRPRCLETTALGSALMAGLAVGVWNNIDELQSTWVCDKSFSPNRDAELCQKEIDLWHKAVIRSQNWV